MWLGWGRGRDFLGASIWILPALGVRKPSGDIYHFDMVPSVDFVVVFYKMVDFMPHF